MKRIGSYSGACLLMAAAPLAAQWLNYPTLGIPRTLNGKPNLTAPVPRTADGRPDLSGIWEGDQPPPFAGNLGLKPGEVVLTPKLTRSHGQSVCRRYYLRTPNCWSPSAMKTRRI